MGDTSKKIYIVEVFNSLAWFAMDALWMLEYPRLAYAFGVPTIVTGIFAIIYSRSRVDRVINLSILFWIMMNISWLLSDIYSWLGDHYISHIFCALAIIFILVSLVVSDYSIEVLGKFRRVRSLSYILRKDK